MKATHAQRILALANFGLSLDDLRDGFPHTTPGASVGDIPYCDLERAESVRDTDAVHATDNGAP